MVQPFIVEAAAHERLKNGSRGRIRTSQLTPERPELTTDFESIATPVRRSFDKNVTIVNTISNQKAYAINERNAVTPVRESRLGHDRSCLPPSRAATGRIG